VRARREASRRCQPLDDGRRDPLDARESQVRRFAWIIVDEPVILVKGHGLRLLLRRYGMRPMWSVTGRGYLLDHHRLADVCAVLEPERYAVRVRSLEVTE
jgi:hypothetical protein